MSLYPQQLFSWGRSCCDVLCARCLAVDIRVQVLESAVGLISEPSSALADFGPYDSNRTIF